MVHLYSKATIILKHTKILKIQLFRDREVLTKINLLILVFQTRYVFGGIRSPIYF